MKLWKKNLTLRELCDMYENSKSQQVRPSTLSTIRSKNRMVCKILGSSSTMQDITSPRFVNRHIEMATFCSQKSKHVHLSHLCSLLRFAFQNDYIPDISCLLKFTKIRIIHETTVENKYLERDEARQLMNCLHQIHPYNSYFIRFLLLTGLRIGEATALKQTDVDYRKQLLTINKSFCHKTGTVTDTKNSSSKRIIPISTETLELLRDYEEYCSKHCVSTRDFLFVSKTFRSHVNHGDVYNSLHDALKRCGIEKKITIHSLRHTYASLLLESNVEVDIISRLLGHKNSVITKDIYLHITNKRRLAEFALIKDITIL